MTEQTRYKYTDTNRVSGNSCVWWSVIRPLGKSTSSGYPGIHKPDTDSPYTALWSWPLWWGWSLFDWVCGQVSFIQITGSNWWS